MPFGTSETRIAGPRRDRLLPGDPGLSARADPASCPRRGPRERTGLTPRTKTTPRRRRTCQRTRPSLYLRILGFLTRGDSELQAPLGVDEGGRGRRSPAPAASAAPAPGPWAPRPGRACAGGLPLPNQPRVRIFCFIFLAGFSK